MIVVRLAENGNLEEYLRRNQGNPISTKDKIKIARDVANGMLHLSSKRVFFSLNNNFNSKVFTLTSTFLSV